MPITEGALDPSRTADPESVRPPFGGQSIGRGRANRDDSAAVERSHISREVEHTDGDRPAHPVVLKEDIAAFRSTVTIPLRSSRRRTPG